MKNLLSYACCLLFASAACAENVTSNVSRVKAWYNDDVHFDTETGEFSSTNIPGAAKSEAMYRLAADITNLYDAAVIAMETNLTPLRASLAEEKLRPVVSLALSVHPENAVDRQNLTMVVVSNAIAQVGTNYHVSAYVFSNNVLRSDPIVEASVETEFGAQLKTFECEWTDYGTNAVTVVEGGEEYETYEMHVDIPTNLVRDVNMLVMKWVRIGSREKMFNFGNRQLRTNGQLCFTTNNASFLGRFTTTNGVDLSELFTPYFDRGEFRFAEKQEEDPE